MRLYARITALLAGLSLLPAHDGWAQTAIEESLRLEAEGAALLLEHYQVERAMLSPDPDRVTVFLTISTGATPSLEEATLFLDGTAVTKHRYTVAEHTRLIDGAAQPLFVSQLAVGEHQLRLEIRTRQGKTQSMSNFSFSKLPAPRFIELQITGDNTRPIKAAAW